MPRRSRLSVMLLAAALMPLAGCVSFGAKPPPQLLTLASRGAQALPLQGGAEPSGAALLVLDPETPRKLATTRVPVQVNATSLAYVKDAQWVDTPRHLFRALLAERIAASGLLVLEPGQFPVEANRRLTGSLSEFGIDAGSRTATVTYDATLLGADDRPLARKRFSASEPVRKISASTIGDPLSRAAHKVVDEVAVWVKDNR